MTYANAVTNPSEIKIEQITQLLSELLKVISITDDAKVLMNSSIKYFIQIITKFNE